MSATARKLIPVHGKAAKQDASLIDMILHYPSPNQFPVQRATIWPMLQQAKRFVFDDEASAFIGELFTKAGREILAQHEWVRAPYPFTWVEMNHRAYWAAATGIGPDETSDLQFGFLVGNGTSYPFSSAPEPDGGIQYGQTFCNFKLHTPMSFEEELEAAQLFRLSRLSYRQMLLGNVDLRDSSWWASPEAAAICRAHKIEVVPDITKILKTADDADVHKLVNSSVGTLKLVLVMLLLLTRPLNRFVYEDRPAARTFVRGKVFVHRPHSKIKLRIERGDPVKRTLAELSEMYRQSVRQEHPVKGHWAQSRKKGAGCDHDWDAEDRDHYRCARCGAARWWRRDHTRGDPKHGSKTSEYDVTR